VEWCIERAGGNAGKEYAALMSFSSAPLAELIEGCLSGSIVTGVDMRRKAASGESRDGRTDCYNMSLFGKRFKGLPKDEKKSSDVRVECGPPCGEVVIGEGYVRIRINPGGVNNVIDLTDFLLDLSEASLDIVLKSAIRLERRDSARKVVG
jgi:hypothetical protein